MNPTQTASNGALLRFMPYPQTGELVNVGVLMNCLQPRFLHFLAEERMPYRVKAFFPQQGEDVYQAALAAVKQDVKRIHARIRDPKTCQIAFNELVRPRENSFRCGEVRTTLTGDPQHFDAELFRRYVRMESSVQQGAVSQR
jgi:hypothetical protein